MTENKNKKEDFINEKKIISELEKNKDFEKIQQELDRGNNFIDYFLVIGLEPEIYKKNWLYAEEFDILTAKHKDEIKPKIISSFPPFEKTTISFDESILNHCFPNGYQLLKSVYMHDEDSIHNTFILFLDILEKAYEMFENEIYFSDYNPSNIVFLNNEAKIIDFDPRFIKFDDKDLGLHNVLGGYHYFLEKVLFRYKFLEELDEDFNDFDDAKRFIKKMENNIRKG